MAKRAVRVDSKEMLKTAWLMSTSGAEWPFVSEHVFHPDRKWRFDWASVELKLAIEVEGVTHYGRDIGRHQSATGIEGDMEKYNAAIADGWALLRYSQRMIERDPHAVVSQIIEVAESRRRLT